MKTLKRLQAGAGCSFFLFGPRGTGKSTWLRSEYPDAATIDLLDPEMFRSYQARPERLFDFIEANRNKRTIVVDEVQKVPEVLDAVHKVIEAHGDLRFVLTGSSARKLKRAGIDLLGGRAAKLTMHPFVASELGGLFSLDDALKYGMLPVVLAERERARKLAAYVDMYLREEIQQEGLVRELGPFTRFLEAISFSQGGLLSLSDVGRECSVKRSTLEGYMAILYDLLIAECVPVFGKRAKRALVSHGKFYFFDVGVFRALRPKGPLDRPAEIDGAALEGLVYQHLRAMLDIRGERGGLYFWRTRAGTEVDFVVYTDNAFWAIEVKNAGNVSRGDLSGLKSFMLDYPEATPMILYRGHERIMNEGILQLPVEEFLTTLSPDFVLA